MDASVTSVQAGKNHDMTESAEPPLLQRWRERVAGQRVRVALADSEDARAIQAALRLYESGLLIPRLVGHRERIAERAGSAGFTLPPDLVLDTRDLASVSTVDHILDDAFFGKSADTREQAQSDPVYLAAAALRAGIVDCCVAGASRSTADVLRAGIRIVGLMPGVQTLSSSFLMLLRDGRVLTFADCAVLPEPTQHQLADIAIAAASTHRTLVDDDPAVAMLSFSTRGSAEHEVVHRVRAATQAVRQRVPELEIDGELQFDAAVVEAVSAHKAPDSAVAGRANVLVFPNLGAGNIGYKITERIGGALALGPILQGLRAPLNDLSRGCHVTDIEIVSLISAVQSLSRQ